LCSGSRLRASEAPYLIGSSRVRLRAEQFGDEEVPPGLSPAQSVPIPRIDCINRCIDCKQQRHDVTLPCHGGQDEGVATVVVYETHTRTALQQLANHCGLAVHRSIHKRCQSGLIGHVLESDVRRRIQWAIQHLRNSNHDLAAAVPLVGRSDALIHVARDDYLHPCHSSPGSSQSSSF